MFNTILQNKKSTTLFYSVMPFRVVIRYFSAIRHKPAMSLIICKFTRWFHLQRTDQGGICALHYQQFTPSSLVMSTYLFARV